MMRTDDNDDGYGRQWDYRVVSRPDTCPDNPRDQRYLCIHRVDYHHDDGYRHMAGDVASYDWEAAEVEGNSIPELLVTLERMQRAVDRPAVIAAEHSTTTTHTFVPDDAVLRVTAKPDTFGYGHHRIEVQFEKHLVHGFALARARELMERLQEAIAEFDVAGAEGDLPR